MRFGNLKYSGFLVMFVLPVVLYSQPLSKEYDIKSAFIEKFTRFIIWPNEDEIIKSDQFVISVIGENPFGEKLEINFKDRKIKNKKVTIRYINSLLELENTNILFVTKSKSREITKICTSLQNHHILIIGDTDGFAEVGVHINFYLENNNMHFYINETAATQAGFKMDYHLLKAATIVNPVKQRK